VAEDIEIRGLALPRNRRPDWGLLCCRFRIEARRLPTSFFLEAQAMRDQRLVIEILRRAVDGQPIRNDLQIEGYDPSEIAASVRLMADEGLVQADFIEPIQSVAPPGSLWVIWGLTGDGRALLERAG